MHSSSKNIHSSSRKWVVHGRVQGVGYRWFVQKHAGELGLSGYARNLDDGTVLVHATGPEEQLNRLAGHLHQGPPGSEVRGVDESSSTPESFATFRIY